MILLPTLQDSMSFPCTLGHMTFILITPDMSRDCLAHVLVYYIKILLKWECHQSRNHMEQISCLSAQHKLVIEKYRLE